jgi:membrane-associated protease RseP (regulator of RpoE activity)
MDVGIILLLGIFFYFILQRSVAGITRTPIWLLWLVMMGPALTWFLWAILVGTHHKVPVILVVVPVLVCSILYWYLLQRGRITPSRSAVTSENSPPLETSSSSASQATPEKSIPRLLTPAEETALQQCFPWNIYYLQQIEYRPQAVLCRGQLRGASDQVYQKIQANVQQQFGDRFFVAFQEGLNGKPFFAIVPNPQAQPEAQKQAQTLNRPVLMIVLLLVTLLTTTQAGLQMMQVPVANIQTWEALKSALPYAISLMTILGLHELGHYWMTRVYRVRATLPYFLPVPVALFPLGTLGAFIQIRSPIPHRKALFDVGIAGPISGLIATIPLLFMGLMQSRVVDIPEKMNLFQFEAINPSSSTLFLILGKLALGAQLTAGHALELHPVAIAGYLGLLVTALNLMPVGQLDGGHIIHAMLGQRGGMMIGQISRFLFLMLALLVRRELILWALLLFLLPSVDEPALNNVTELDNRRDLLGVLAIALLLLIILPAPGALVKVLLG